MPVVKMPKKQQSKWKVNMQTSRIGVEANSHSAGNRAPSKAMNAEQLRSLRGKSLLVGLLEYSRETFHSVCWQSGISLHLYGHSIDGLKAIDRNINESALEACRAVGLEPEPHVLWEVYHYVGTYFGDVIVNNLGGRWLFPSRFRLWISQIMRRPEILFDHWYVELRGNRIPVFKIARWRCDGSGRVKSLVEVYEEMASKGLWSG